MLREMTSRGLAPRGHLAEAHSYSARFAAFSYTPPNAPNLMLRGSSALACASGRTSLPHKLRSPATSARCPLAARCRAPESYLEGRSDAPDRVPRFGLNMR